MINSIGPKTQEWPNMMYHDRDSLYTHPLTLASQGVLGAQDQFTGVPKPLFQSEDILEISLESYFKAVFSNKDDSTVFPAVLKVRDNDGALRAFRRRPYAPGG